MDQGFGLSAPLAKQKRTWRTKNTAHGARTPYAAQRGIPKTEALGIELSQVDKPTVSISAANHRSAAAKASRRAGLESERGSRVLSGMGDVDWRRRLPLTPPVGTHHSSNAASNLRVDGSKSTLLVKWQASSAPASLSIPLSSHSIESGPV